MATLPGLLAPESFGVSSGAVGFAAAAPSRDGERPFEFLLFSVSPVWIEGEPRPKEKWCAVVNSQRYLDYDSKAELLNDICYDLSMPCPEWAARAMSAGSEG